ncbi:DNA gyrase subunit A, partial [Candidatus Woesearchaeota archaeon]|nr:DNA gyrase subunit A [Candidatus Woesearchaeota archaeon]
SKGVRGVSLKDDDEVIGMIMADDAKTVFTVTENGYGKRTKIADYRRINRGGVGVRNIQCSQRNGKVVAVKSVEEEDDVILISRHGIIIRMSMAGISVIGRNTQGVRLMRISGDDKVISAAKVMKE